MNGQSKKMYLCMKKQTSSKRKNRKINLKTDSGILTQDLSEEKVDECNKLDLTTFCYDMDVVSENSK